MKIQQFELRDFIQVDSQTKQFGDASLVLFHGPNESGKSTFLEAIRQSLFGFANNTLSRTNKISATVNAILKNGDQLTFTRRRKRKDAVEGTLFGSSGKTQIDEQRLFECFDGCDRAMYEQLFGFSLEDVTRGEERLKHASLQEALLGASQSSAISWQQINQSLVGERESLAKPRSRTLPLDKSAAEIERIKEQILEIEVRATEFSEMQREQDLLDRESKDLKRQIGDIQIGIDREKLQKSLAPDARHWLELRAEIDALKIPRNLNRDWIDRYKKQQNEIDTRIIEKNKLNQDLEQRQSDQTNIATDTATDDQQLLTHEADVVELSRQSAILNGGNQSAQVDLTKKQSLIEQIESTAAAMQLSELHYTELLNRAFQIDRNTLEELCKEWTDISLQLDNCTNELTTQTNKLADLQKRDATDTTISSESLSEIEAATTQLENHHGQHLETKQMLQSLRQELESDLGLTEDFKALWNLESITSTSDFDADNLVLLAEQIESLRAEVRTADMATKDLVTRKKTLNRELQTLEIADDLPTRSDLNELRLQRKRLIETLQEPETDEIELFSNLNNEASKELIELIQCEERMVDTILDSADLFAKRDALVRQLKELENTTKTQARELQKSKKLVSEACKKYFENWPESWWKTSLLQSNELVLNTQGKELRSWPILIDRWRSAQKRIIQSTDSVEQKAQATATGEKLLRSLLTREATLSELVTTQKNSAAPIQFTTKIREKLNDLRKTASEAADNKAQLRAVMETLEGQKQKRDSLTKQFDQQRAAISGFLISISRTLKLETPQQSRSILRQIETLAGWREAVRELDNAIEARKRAEQDFINNATNLFHSLNRKLPEEKSSDSSTSALAAWHTVVQKIESDLAMAKKRAATSILNKEAIRTLRERIETIDSDHRAAQESLDRSLKEIGSPDDDQLKVWLDSFDHWQQQTSNHEQIGNRLDSAKDQSTAESTEQFANRISQLTDSETNQSNLTELETKKRLLIERLETKSDDLSRQRERMEQLKSRTKLEELHQELESQYAKLNEIIEQYMTLSMAETLLKRTIHADRFEDSDSLLAVSGNILASLTDGRYARIVHAKSKNKSSFALIEKSGIEKSPDELSTGTREQLFLAIRLAFILQYCNSHEPMPVVMDDCFVNFDDHRLRSTIKALGQFDSSIQILLLSCQNRTFDAVNELIPNAEIVSFATDAFVST